MPRPSDYTPELAGAICDHLADGKSMRQIEQLPGMPSARTVYRWLDQHDSFRQQYARARESQMEDLLEEILEIADDASNDTIQTPEGPRPNLANINRARLRIDARKWVMSKLAPKKYGDRVDLTSGGEKLPATPAVFHILPASQRPLDNTEEHE